MSKKKYLVTGGAGFLGASLVIRLLKAGNPVVVIDNGQRHGLHRLQGLDDDLMTLVSCDIRDEAKVVAAAEGCDVIVHMAAVNGTRNFYNKPDLVLDVGIMGMRNALLASKNNPGVKDFFLLSSSEVYQDSDEIPTTEKTLMKVPDTWNPRYSYGGSKLISELMLANAKIDSLERSVIIRPHNVYGPNMGWDHVVPEFVVRAHELSTKSPGATSIDFPIQGDGQQTRSFIYVEDFTDGVMITLDKGEDRNIYHIGTMDELNMAEMAQQVVATFGLEAKIVPGSLPQGSAPRRCPDTAKLTALGFAPNTPLKDGLTVTKEWYVANIDKSPKHDDNP
ncbi:MAG: NAD-dependent epimerase/dehydratase family protein [Rhodospirillales bacterium]